MNDSEGLLDLLGANTVAFRAESISVTWAASEEERAVDERLQISLRVTTEPRDDELKPFTDRFGEGWVTLIALKGEYQHNDDGQPVIGILGRRNDEIIVRVLVSPTYLVGRQPRHASQALRLESPFGLIKNCRNGMVKIGSTFVIVRSQWGPSTSQK
jgi:hypothetical protein